MLALVNLSTAAAIKPRADSFKLYAYGENITHGLDVFLADGIAYAGSQTPSNASSISNITLSTADSKSGTWMVTTDAGDTFNWGVANSGNTLETVGVANASSSMNTTGFGLYGAWAYRLSDAGEIEMNYRAVPTGVDDLYIIKWAPSATVDDSALLINLRTASPVPITDKNKNKQ
ncbi:hypothetical protein MPH_07270 [Macrophomina phaseolina MS6]|uniref:Uncharacterized protein n=2 Tax=Macrophomina phaseolina TaxID=35725 RepID=K2SFF9_MACPH|nr:hypothetical protein MPH_07270 [Macrophomina phaseolina MS6]